MQRGINFRVASGDVDHNWWHRAVFNCWYIFCLQSLTRESITVGRISYAKFWELQYPSERWLIYLCIFLFAITDICLSTGWILIFRIYRHLIWWVIYEFWFSQEFVVISLCWNFSFLPQVLTWFPTKSRHHNYMVHSTFFAADFAIRFSDVFSSSFYLYFRNFYVIQQLLCRTKFATQDDYTSNNFLHLSANIQFSKKFRKTAISA